MIMPVQKKFQTVKDLVVFPSKEETIEVLPNDGYEGAHRYRAKMSLGYDSKKKKNVYSDKTDTIQFVQKNEDGTIIPGWQSEQLAMILLDRVQKLNAKYPSEYNEKQIEGLQIYLDACRARIENRLNRGVYGELKK